MADFVLLILQAIIEWPNLFYDEKNSKVRKKLFCFFWFLCVFSIALPASQLFQLAYDGHSTFDLDNDFVFIMLPIIGAVLLLLMSWTTLLLVYLERNSKKDSNERAQRLVRYRFMRKTNHPES